MRLRLLFITLFLCLAVLPASAQDATWTPQSEQGFILGWTTESIYPAAIRFTIDLAQPIEGLTSADLFIQPENRDAITVSIDLQDAAVVKEPYTKLAYVWMLPADKPPSLFQNITFKWRVISSDNEVSLITDAMLFTDQREGWLRDQAIGDGIKVTLPDIGVIAQLRNTIKPVYDLLAASTGQKPTYRVLLNDLSVCTVNASQDVVAVGPVSQTEVPCDPAMADSIFKVSDFEVINSASGGIADIQNAFAAFLTDNFYHNFWIGKNVPAWFQSGLGRFYAPTSKNLYGPLVTHVARTNSLLSLNEMAVQPTSAADAEFWTAQSYGMVVYIASRLGVDGLFKLAKDIQNVASFSTAYQSALGEPIGALLPNLSRWIFTSAGQAAFSFTPYQSATATPTASDTPTPTSTPTPIASDTLTPTPTVTGFLSLTPRPSLTPTARPTAAPPTHTPRPPGSLNTATPLPPSAISQVAENPRLSLFVLVIGVLIIAIIALIYRLLRGR